MRVLVACKRGNVAARSRSGHCLCVDCKAFRSEQAKSRGKTEAHVRWVEENKHRQAGYDAKWIAANLEKRKAVVASWRERNPEKVAEMSAKAGKKWAMENRGVRNASVKARQYAKRLAMPSWVDKKEVADFYVEAARLSELTGVPHEVDHIIPIQNDLVCGLHVPANLRVISRSENRSKRNKFEVIVCEY